MRTYGGLLINYVVILAIERQWNADRHDKKGFFICCIKGYDKL